MNAMYQDPFFWAAVLGSVCGVTAVAMEVTCALRLHWRTLRPRRWLAGAGVAVALVGVYALAQYISDWGDRDAPLQPTEERWLLPGMQKRPITLAACSDTPSGIPASAVHNQQEAGVRGWLSECVYRTSWPPASRPSAAPSAPVSP